MVWAALSDKYFTAIIAPVNADLELNPDAVRETRLVRLSEDPGTHEDLTIRMVSRPVAVGPGESGRLLLDCYLGPKSRDAFVKDVPRYVARNYYGQVEASYKLGCCAFLTFSWLIELMVWLLNALHSAFHNYGVAIIILVLIVRTLLHPITKKAQVNMVRMQKQMAFIAPKLEEVKKRYGNDKVKLQQETMKVYAEAGINPAAQMLNMLPLFLQMPIWIALYSSLSVNIAMRHRGFVLWIRDLTGPDALVSFGQAVDIPLLSFILGPVHSFNLLPILLSIAFVVQQKLMPKPPKPQGEPTPAQVQQQQMQKMMPIMSVMFGLFLYNAPSGLTLYIMASTVIGTLEQWRIRRHIKRDEERGKFEFKPPQKPKGPRKPSLFEKLQQAAEDAQRQKSRRDKK
jgi:YidC/Oxa1 family membrane protein insertase